MLRNDANSIINAAIAASMPYEGTKRALAAFEPRGKTVLFAVGKAGFSMARAAQELLGDRIDRGIVITKYGHASGAIDDFEIYEAGHPIPDEAGVAAATRAIALANELTENDSVLFLLSGGASALFEKPLVPLSELVRITEALLKSGASIDEINAVRKRLSAVKGGRFALECGGARIFLVVLSDVLSSRLDTVGGGPVLRDESPTDFAARVVEKYAIPLTDEAARLIRLDTPINPPAVETAVAGSIHTLCEAAARECRRIGYNTCVISESLSCEAKDAGKMLAEFASAPESALPCAFVFGGETVVKVTGNGRGGRNQELALSAAKHIDGRSGTAVFSIGSDGTDGPTDAAGGFVDGGTAAALREKGIDLDAALADNDSYNALDAVGSLIFTGATGTNVNDLSVALVRNEELG